MTDPFIPGLGGSAARFASGSFVRPASLASRLDNSTSLTNKEKGINQSFIRHGTLTGGTVCDSTASRVDSCGNLSIRASFGHLRRLGLTREASPPSFSTDEQSDDVLVSDRDTVVPCVACRCALTRPSPHFSRFGRLILREIGLARSGRHQVQRRVRRDYSWKLYVSSFSSSVCQGRKGMLDERFVFGDG